MNPLATSPTSEVSAPLEAEQSFPAVQTGAFGIRFAGRLIDWLFSIFLGFIGNFTAGMILGGLVSAGVVRSDWLQSFQTSSFFAKIGWSLTASMLYATVCESIAGATLGKLLLGYRVVTVSREPIGAWAAFKRNLAYFVDAFFFGLPAYSAMSKSALHQRIGDSWANTIVAKQSTLPATSKRSGGLIALGIFGGAAAQVICKIVSMFSTPM